MNKEKKIETLTRALRCCRFPEYYFIGNDENHFLIIKKENDETLIPQTKCMSFRELDAYLGGYYLALVKPVKHHVGPQFYIEYLNKEQNYEKDSKTFATYSDAFAWAAINIPNFQPDMIKFLT